VAVAWWGNPAFRKPLWPIVATLFAALEGGLTFGRLFGTLKFSCGVNHSFGKTSAIKAHI